MTAGELPLAAALPGAFATWVVVAIGGYLAVAAGLPSWQRDVRDLAWRRRKERIIGGRWGEGSELAAALVYMIWPVPLRTLTR